MRLQSLFLLSVLTLGMIQTAAAELTTAAVREAQGQGAYVAEAVVEAVRQTAIAPQVSGRITQLMVKAGDTVQKGQVLLRIDAQAAVQQAHASQAQVNVAQAQLEVARKELERQQQLFRKQYISQAALDQAQAQFKATEATVKGMTAQANAAGTQTGFYTLVAPFNGRVASVDAELGDMAMPGKTVLILFDPTAMRVLANLPQSKLALLKDKAPVAVELPGLAGTQQSLTSSSLTVLPSANATTHTVPIRVGLPTTPAAILPGMFARVSFPLQADGQKHLLIPAQAVIHRTELDAVYVVSQGKALLRQVRLGESVGKELEVLSGLNAGERVALDPVAASRTR